MSYNNDRKGYETKDGGLIRINGADKVRIDIYDGDERVKGGHTRDIINYDTNSGKGTIDQHNDDKSEKSSTDVGCFLTTACMKHHLNDFNDNCCELVILRWFRDNYVLKNEIDYYYNIAPTLVEKINNTNNCDEIYKYIYENVIITCIKLISKKEYTKAYSTYKNCVSFLEKLFITKEDEVQFSKTYLKYKPFKNNN